MTKRHQIEIETLGILIFGSLVGFAFALYSGHRPQLPTAIYLPSMQSKADMLSTLSPTPTHPPTKPQVTSQVSPDGTKLLTLAVITNQNNSKTYTFVTSNADGKNQNTTYTTISSKDSWSIPFNTWSPDNKYLFITHITSSGSEGLVLRTDGKLITETESNLNTRKIFTDKNTGNTYEETTGWASETLLIINTKLADGSKGPSYWLEIPSKGIIQLSSQF